MKARANITDINNPSTTMAQQECEVQEKSECENFNLHHCIAIFSSLPHAALSSLGSDNRWSLSPNDAAKALSTKTAGESESISMGTAGKILRGECAMAVYHRG
jgi:hypothetical protein